MSDFKGYSVAVKMVDGRAAVQVVVDGKEYIIDEQEGFGTPDGLTEKEIVTDLLNVVNHLPGVVRLMMAIAQDFPIMKAGKN